MRCSKTLLALPDECLLLILDFIRPSDVESMLLTNWRLHEVTSSTKKYFMRKSSRENANAVFELFTRETAFPRRRISALFQPQAKLNYLELCDDLGWLALHDLSIRYRPEHRSLPVQSDPTYFENLEFLKESASSFGLTIPASFLRVAESSILQSYLPTPEKNGFRFNIGRIQGRIVPFQRRTEDNRTRALYLGASGAHCVLEGPMERTADLELLSTNFESFLVHEYFSTWLLHSAEQFRSQSRRVTRHDVSTVDYSPMWLDELQEDYIDHVRPRLGLEVSVCLQYSSQWMDARQRLRSLQTLPFAGL